MIYYHFIQLLFKSVKRSKDNKYATILSIIFPYVIKFLVLIISSFGSSCYLVSFHFSLKNSL